jgi:hypothetical protein
MEDPAIVEIDGQFLPSGASANAPTADAINSDVSFLVMLLYVRIDLVIGGHEFFPEYFLFVPASYLSAYRTLGLSVGLCGSVSWTKHY